MPSTTTLRHQRSDSNPRSCHIGEHLSSECARRESNSPDGRRLFSFAAVRDFGIRSIIAGMRKTSAGILMFKRVADDLFVLLAHPGGPFWKNRDAGAWTIPKGELDDGEDASAAARREFIEEIGIDPGGELEPLGEIMQKGGKRVIAFAAEGDFDVATLRSNTFEIEWPPRSGRLQEFPEVDRAAWMTVAEARKKILPSQVELLHRLLALTK